MFRYVLKRFNPLLALLVACQPREPGANSLKGPTVTPIKATSSGFIEVNGFKLWHEVYGDGEPLVLLHGGLMTISEMMPLGEPLAKHRKLVALELQGHGHSADTDRPLALATLGDDVAAVIDKLGLGKADVVGYSFGADVALRLAIQHPDNSMQGTKSGAAAASAVTE